MASALRRPSASEKTGAGFNAGSSHRDENSQLNNYIDFRMPKVGDPNAPQFCPRGLLKPSTRTRLPPLAFGSIFPRLPDGREPPANSPHRPSRKSTLRLPVDEVPARFTPARKGRTPLTGAAIKIAAAKKLTFAPAKAGKDRLNG